MPAPRAFVFLPLRKSQIGLFAPDSGGGGGGGGGAGHGKPSNRKNLPTKRVEVHRKEGGTYFAQRHVKQEGAAQGGLFDNVPNLFGGSAPAAKQPAAKQTAEPGMWMQHPQLAGAGALLTPQHRNYLRSVFDHHLSGGALPHPTAAEHGVSDAQANTLQQMAAGQLKSAGVKNAPTQPSDKPQPAAKPAAAPAKPTAPAKPATEEWTPSDDERMMAASIYDTVGDKDPDAEGNPDDAAFEALGLQRPNDSSAAGPIEGDPIENKADTYHYEEQAGKKKRVRGKRTGASGDDAPRPDDQLQQLGGLFANAPSNDEKPTEPLQSASKPVTPIDRLRTAIKHLTGRSDDGTDNASDSDSSDSSARAGGTGPGGTEPGRPGQDRISPQPANGGSPGGLFGPGDSGRADEQSDRELPQHDGGPAESGHGRTVGAGDGSADVPAVQPVESAPVEIAPLAESDLTPPLPDPTDAAIVEVALQNDVEPIIAAAQVQVLEGHGLDAEQIDNAISLDRDLRLTDADNIGTGGLRQKTDDNFAAVELLKQLEAEQREPTLEEKKQLARFVGWGGFGQAFQKKFDQYLWATTYESLPSYMRQGWSQADKDHFAINRLLREHMDEDEFKAARRSALNAHYTSPQVVQWMWSAVQHFGFEGGRVLEPAMGAGNFFGFMPDGLMARTRRTGVELDSITGRIAALLYPASTVHQTGFQNAPLPDNHFDLAISNVPFGSYRVADKTFVDRAMTHLSRRIHNYFFAKALDKVRPGGVVAFITSHHTLDAAGNRDIREYLDRNAHFLGAVRLHNKAFAGNAGTSVTTDVIFLQKRDPAFEALHPRDALGRFIAKFTDVVRQTAKDGQEYEINEYFAAHPEMVSGEMGVGSGYGVASATDTGAKPREGEDLGEFLQKSLESLPGDIFYQPTDQAVVAAQQEVQEAAAGTTPGAYVIGEDGALYKNVLGVLEKQDLAKKGKDFNARAIGQTKIREIAYTLIQQQNEDANPIVLEAARRKLNTAYDGFVRKFGMLHDPKNQRAFEADPHSGMLLALEKMEKGKPVVKAPIFSQRTTQPAAKATSARNAVDALAIAQNETNELNWKRMSELLQRPAAEIRDELAAGGHIFRDPEGMHDPSTQGWVTAEEYLSGEVRDKLKLAQAIAANDPGFAPNVKALEQVIPADLGAADIQVRPGCTWIPLEYYHDFTEHLIGDGTGASSRRRRDGDEEADEGPDGQRGDLLVKYSSIDNRYSVPALKSSDTRRGTVDMTQRWGTPRANAMKLFEDMLNLKQTTVMDRDSDGNSHLNEDATNAARAKQAEILSEFQDWLWKDTGRALHLGRIYNDTFNGQVLQQFDGSHLTFPGLAAHVYNEGVRKHIRDGVWRAVKSGRCLFDHVVGAGKTRVITMTAMELKRLGLAKKNMIVVPNHVMAQWQRDIQTLYPGANVLTVWQDSWSPKQRKEFSYRIATGDWDIVLVPMSVFERMPASPQLYEEHYERQLAELREAIGEADDDKTAKQLEAKLADMEARVEEKKLKAQAKADEALPFDEMGVDSLFVDEAHYYKNLYFLTKLKSMAGLSARDAGRATDLFIKSQWLMKKNNNRGLYLATGTPISNSMAEMYTMKRFLMMPELIKKGLDRFDNWAATFGQIESTVEALPQGGYGQRLRFAKFFNVPEMIKLYRSVADVRTRQDLANILPTPPVANDGRPFTHVAAASAGLRNYVKDLQERVEAIQAGLVPKSDDNFLKVTVDGRKASLDLRLVDPGAADDPDGKVNQCVANAARIHGETADRRATQMIFLDLGTPKGSELAAGKKKRGKAAGGDSGGESGEDSLDESGVDAVAATIAATTDPVAGEAPADPNAAADVETAEEQELRTSVYQDIKNKLIASGVPQHEIAFAHDFEKPEEKRELSDRMKSGEIRILIGSTGKMGSGLNAQDRLFALHHLDCPWKPADLEQREGRIVLQGNLHEKWGIPVELHRYTTKGSFDEFMWQSVEKKAGFIEQARRGDLMSRDMEEIDQTVMDAKNTRIASSDNPWVQLEGQVAKKLNDILSLKRSHARNREASQHKIATIPAEIAQQQDVAGKYESASAEWERRKPKDGGFFMKVGGQDGKMQGLEKREAAGDALLQAWRKNLFAMKGGQGTPLGEIAGFAIKGVLPSTDGANEPTFNVYTPSGQYIGRVSSDSAKGITARIENVLNGLGARGQDLRGQVARLQGEQAKLQEQIELRFPHEDEMRKLTRQHKIYELLMQNNDRDHKMTEAEATALVDGVKLPDASDGPKGPKMPALTKSLTYAELRDLFMGERLLPARTLPARTLGEVNHGSPERFAVNAAAALLLSKAGLFGPSFGLIPDNPAQLRKAVASGYPLAGRRVFQGLQVSVENRKGSYRIDKAHTPPQWKTKMGCDYGYLRGTEAVDGDHLDVFVGPDENATHAYIVRQLDPKTGAFDEQKVMLGFPDATSARRMYLQHYDSPDFFGGITPMPMAEFKRKALQTLARTRCQGKAAGVVW